MNELGRVQSKTKTGNESLQFNGNNLPFKLIDFWKWSVSDILSNATRGRFAEFIVATVTNVDLNLPRVEWQSYDLLTPDNIKIEIKSAAFIQSWYQKELSKIVFKIKPVREWNSETGIQSEIPKWHADVYVMCLLFQRKQGLIEPLDMTQWLFFVLSKHEIEKNFNNRRSITLKSLEKLTDSVAYNKLYDEIKEKNFHNKKQ